jgi:parvulin-like peptidyl-prolyl isomerase
MKRSLSIILAAAISISVMAAAISCKKKEESPKPAARQAQPLPLTPEEKKQVEEMKKGVKESKRLVVAKVNSAEITMHDLIKEMNAIAPRYIKPGDVQAGEVAEMIKKEALERLIAKELAVQESKRQGIEIKKEMIDNVIKQFINMAGSEKAFKEDLKQRGMTEAELRKSIERMRRFELITKKEIYEKIKVDDNILKKEYEKNKAGLIKPEMFVAEDLFFGPGKFDKDTMKKAQEVVEIIKKSDNDFSKLPKDSAYMLSKTKVSNARHPETFAAMTKMKTGQVSGVIKDIDGIHIVKMLGKEPARQMTFEEAKKLLQRDYMAMEGEKRMKDWTDGLKKIAKVEITLAEVEEKLKKEAEKKK